MCMWQGVHKTESNCISSYRFYRAVCYHECSHATVNSKSSLKAEVPCRGTCGTVDVAVDNAGICNNLDLIMCCFPAITSCTAFDHNFRAVESMKQYSWICCCSVPVVAA